jgi:hypothetical protein
MLDVAERAEAIAEQYLAALPATYASRLSSISEPDTVEVLLKGFASGLNDRDCCLAAGVSTRTLSRWYELAEADPQSAHGLFVTALKQARAEGKLRRLQKIEEHGNSGPKHWVALAWLNERTDQAQFALQKTESDGPKVVVQIGVKDSDVAVNVIANYQTHTESECVLAQPLSASPLDGFAGESGERKRLTPGEGDVQLEQP